MVKAVPLLHELHSSLLLMKITKSKRKKNSENYISVDLIKSGTGFIIWAAHLMKH